MIFISIFIQGAWPFGVIGNLVCVGSKIQSISSIHALRLKRKKAEKVNSIHALIYFYTSISLRNLGASSHMRVSHLMCFDDQSILASTTSAA